MQQSEPLAELQAETSTMLFEALCAVGMTLSGQLRIEKEIELPVLYILLLQLL
jgi:hypothetical protein